MVVSCVCVVDEIACQLLYVCVVGSCCKPWLGSGQLSVTGGLDTVYGAPGSVICSFLSEVRVCAIFT